MSTSVPVPRAARRPDARQLPLDLRSPCDHFDLLLRRPHADASTIVWTPGRAKRWHKLPLDDLERAREQLAALVNEPDVYLTPSEFYGWRQVRLLSGLNAIPLDFDLSHAPNAPIPSLDALKRFAEGKLTEIQQRGWPLPNAVLYTGRGVHLYWLIEREGRWRLPEWQDVITRLARALNADRRAIDCARVLRVAGSIHGLTKRLVTGEVLSPAPYVSTPTEKWVCATFVDEP